MIKVTDKKDVPLGIRFIQNCFKKSPSLTSNRNVWYRGSVVLLTFLTYTCYHMNRKPISVVKNVLYRNCTGVLDMRASLHKDVNWCNWEPFDGSDAMTLLGFVDSSFLFAHAAAMFVSGMVADRMNLRYFLVIGMILSGIASYLLGFIKYFGVHSLIVFVGVQIFGGIFQTTGWPGVVAVMGNWFGKSKRGFVFGVWNSNTCIGNILGTVIAGYYVESDWGLSFIVPGLIIAVMGLLNFLFLVPDPYDVNCDVPDHRPLDVKDKGNSANAKSEGPNVKPDVRPVGFCGALKIPGVIEFSLCLFFSKLVCYTFLYWLPNYIKASTSLTPGESADLSTVFDVGGIVGGILAGIISDYSGKSASTCAVMLVVAVPVLQIYNMYGAAETTLNMCLLLAVGLLVNGPYSLITTAVSAELGTHHSLQDNAKALATVTAIIDGTGSIGAAVGPLLAGVVSQWGWRKVFYMLITSDVIALLLLTRLVKRELIPPVTSSHSDR